MKVDEAVRDRRAMSHMTPEILQVHLRLEAWGRWSRDQLSAYPSTTLLGRWMEQGEGAAQVGHQSLVMPDAVAETDRAVRHLGAVDRKAVFENYVSRVSFDVAARRCNMRIRQFQNVLTRARWRICGFLAASTL